MGTLLDQLPHRVDRCKHVTAPLLRVPRGERRTCVSCIIVRALCGQASEVSRCSVKWTAPDIGV